MNDVQRAACFLADHTERLLADVEAGRITADEFVYLLSVGGNVAVYRDARQAMVAPRAGE